MYSQINASFFQVTMEGKSQPAYQVLVPPRLTPCLSSPHRSPSTKAFLLRLPLFQSLYLRMLCFLGQAVFPLSLFSVTLFPGSTDFSITPCESSTFRLRK